MAILGVIIDNVKTGIMIIGRNKIIRTIRKVMAWVAASGTNDGEVVSDNGAAVETDKHDGPLRVCLVYGLQREIDNLLWYLREGRRNIIIDV